MHLVVFESSRWHTFAPLTLNRPAFSLLCGMTTLLDKQIRHIAPKRLTLWVRPALAEYCRKYVVPRTGIPTAVNEPLDDEPALISSGRSLHFSRFQMPDEESVVKEEQQGEELVRKAYVRRPGLTHEDALNRTNKWTKLLDLPSTETQARLAEYIWDLINWNEEAIVADSLALRDPKPLPKGPYHVINEENIWLDSDVKLAPGVVLDATRGPIAVCKGVSIGANSVIQGPCHIGDYTQMAPLTNIRPGTTLGVGTRIGGCVLNSVVLGFTEKFYEGYLGDSYVGRWANLGGGTTTANVKTTYGEVRMRIGGRDIPTGRRTLGAIIGDHTKTAINTRFSPGCYVGYCSTLAAAGLVPKFVPSFSYWTDEGMRSLDVDKSVAIARRVMDRRDRQWSSVEDEVHRYAASAAPAVEK
jgi:UDP-N-acetylglucosamine diphosphorylase/glucosamine-1-phosphate N-acetyltransferase